MYGRSRLWICAARVIWQATKFALSLRNLRNMFANVVRAYEAKLRPIVTDNTLQLAKIILFFGLLAHLELLK